MPAKKAPPSAQRKRQPVKSQSVQAAATTQPTLVEARRSSIHGTGVYAATFIKKGTRIIEYLGERISHAEADHRYEIKGDDDGHTFLFIASTRTVIDAGVDGNEARFINHHCSPNCETVIEKSRVFIEAIRNIEPGEELGYDYQLTWESTDDPQELAMYECRCGAKRCRGTMLDREPLDKVHKRVHKRVKKAVNKGTNEAGGKKGSNRVGKQAGRKQVSK
jgi:SET domain-containing protein